MKLTKKQAKELSIKKWEYIVKNKGKSEGLTDEYPELHNLQSNCGYCEKYLTFNSRKYCKNCPLNLSLKDACNVACLMKPHPFEKWFNKPTKVNAQKVLDLIKEL